ncbi:MAG TPA: hypothetical protein PKC84_00880 [Paracoccaceae bacterium]|nr:hypothetical protein [Paracoccaceae bacterium]
MPYRLHAHVAPPRLMATPPDLAGDLTRQATARALGVTEDDARTLIANGGPVAEGAARDFAGHLCGYLAGLGLAVLQPGDPDGDRWDLALQPRDPAAVPALAVAIAQVLRRDAVAVAAALAGPVGMVIGGGDMTDGQRARLERMAGLRVLAAQPATARFDLLPGRPADPATLPALSRMLDRLGHRRCPLTGAVAVDIGRAERDALLRRFPAAGLVAVCRAFQRFDLVLAGMDGMTPADAADFLAVRSDIPRGAFGTGRVAADLVVDRDLPREQARAFQRDYAAIGLRTVMRPVVLARSRV